MTGSRRCRPSGYGYRRIQVFLARRGHSMSTDRAHRLWFLVRRIPLGPVTTPPDPMGSARIRSINTRHPDRTGSQLLPELP
jgi:hypothetical protein